MANPMTKTTKKATPAKSKAAKPKSNAKQALQSYKARAQKAAEKYKAGVDTAIHGAEVAGSCFLASMAEGAWGEETLAPFGGIDLRYIAGGGLWAYGVIEAARGNGAAPHLAALGAGILCSGLANAGRNIGEEIAGSGAGFAGVIGAPRPTPTPRATPNMAGVRPVAR